MGKGRTTTGMILACLIKDILFGDTSKIYYKDSGKYFFSRLKFRVFRGPLDERFWSLPVVREILCRGCLS